MSVGGKEVGHLLRIFFLILNEHLTMFMIALISIVNVTGKGPNSTIQNFEVLSCSLMSVFLSDVCLLIMAFVVRMKRESPYKSPLGLPSWPLPS